MVDPSRLKFHSSILQVASMIKAKELNKECKADTKKRERQANFTADEISKLVDLIIARKDVLENKKSSAELWQEKKQAWDEIEKCFNKKRSKNSLYRDSKTLRIKYESIKRDIKRKWASILAGKKTAHGKTPKFLAYEKKVKNLLQLPVREGFCDFSTTDDKDDEDDTNSMPSSTSSVSSITKDQDIMSVKMETARSDVDDVTIEMNENQMNDDEPSSAQKICIDPLVDNIKGPQEDRLDYKIKKEKLKSTELQNVHLQQEIKLQTLKLKILEEELEHKKTLYELETKRINLKINALKYGHNSWDNDDNSDND